MTNKVPSVIIIGRQNVGKSTLFNSLIKERKAIVDPYPGLTRDIISYQITHKDITFILSDTPGLDIKDSSELSKSILDNAMLKLKEASLIVLLLENPAPASYDMDLIKIVRKLSKPSIVAINKMDNNSDLENLANFYEMGFTELLPLSAIRRINLDLLLDKIIELLPLKKKKLQAPALKITIVGRPNSGKSTLLNAFIGYNRSIVSDIPGTTRDSVDEDFIFHGQRITIIDTAGIRRKSRINDDISYYSLNRTIKAINNSHIVFHLIDAKMGLTETDKKISDEIMKAKKPAIIIINKWDLIEKDNKTFNEYREKLTFKFYKAADYPIISVSAKNKTRIHKLIQTALELKKKSEFKIETSKLNKIIEQIQSAKRPPQMGEKFKILYATQIGTNPPRFKLFVNKSELFKKDIMRFLEKYLQNVFNLNGVPVILSVEGKKKSNKTR